MFRRIWSKIVPRSWPRHSQNRVTEFSSVTDEVKRVKPFFTDLFGSCLFLMLLKQHPPLKLTPNPKSIAKRETECCRGGAPLLMSLSIWYFWFRSFCIIEKSMNSIYIPHFLPPGLQAIWLSLLLLTFSSFRKCEIKFHTNVTSLLLVRMSPNTVCVRACALVLAVVTCPFVITVSSREHE